MNTKNNLVKIVVALPVVWFLASCTTQQPAEPAVNVLEIRPSQENLQKASEILRDGLIEAGIAGSAVGQGSTKEPYLTLLIPEEHEDKLVDFLKKNKISYPIKIEFGKVEV